MVWQTGQDDALGSRLPEAAVGHVRQQERRWVCLPPVLSSVSLPSRSLSLAIALSLALSCSLSLSVSLSLSRSLSLALSRSLALDLAPSLYRVSTFKLAMARRESRARPSAERSRGMSLSDTMYLSIRFTKPTPPQNRQLNILISNSKQ